MSYSQCQINKPHPGQGGYGFCGVVNAKENLRNPLFFKLESYPIQNSQLKTQNFPACHVLITCPVTSLWSQGVFAERDLSDRGSTVQACCGSKSVSSAG